MLGEVRTRAGDQCKWRIARHPNTWPARAAASVCRLGACPSRISEDIKPVYNLRVHVIHVGDRAPSFQISMVKLP